MTEIKKPVTKEEIEELERALKEARDKVKAAGISTNIVARIEHGKQPTVEIKNLSQP